MKAMIGRMVAMVLFFWQGLSANVMVRPPLCYETRFELTNGMPKVKQSCTLTLTIKALQDLPNTSVHLYTPEGVAVVNGKRAATMSLIKGDSVAIPYVLRTARPGAFRVDARISPAQPDSLHWEEKASHYIVSRSDTAFCSDTSLRHFSYNIGLTSKELPPTFGMPTSTLEISGWVSYRIYYDWYANYAALPEIEMSLASQSGNTIRTWNTDDSGSYDQTFSDLANGIYIINMISKNTAARVCDFSSPDPFTLAEEVIVVDGNTVTYWSPVIEDSTLDDACQILVNILKSKSWAQEHFSCTLNFVNAVHPVPGYIPLSGYCFRLFLWHNGPTVPGTDAIYIKKGVSDGYDNDIWGPWGKPVTSHEWAHAFMCKTFDDKIPVGWGPDTSHYKWKVTNPGFAFGEGFAEFMGPAVWLDEYGSGSGDGTGMGKRDTSHIN